MRIALEAGINFLDMASADTVPFPAYGRAITGMRETLYFQIHFGADYTSGKYGWTTNLDTIKRSIANGALDKTGVLAIIARVRNRADIQKLLGYFSAAPEEKDYSVLDTLAPPGRSGNMSPSPIGWRKFRTEQVFRF